MAPDSPQSSVAVAPEKERQSVMKSEGDGNTKTVMADTASASTAIGEVISTIAASEGEATTPPVSSEVSKATASSKERRRPDFDAIMAELKKANRELTKEQFYERYPRLEIFKRMPPPEDCARDTATAMAAVRAATFGSSSDGDDEY